MPGWFETHPGGIAIISKRHPEQLAVFDLLYCAPQRNKRISIVAARPEADPDADDPAG